MNPVIEEAMTNLIKRVNFLEEEVHKLKSGKQTTPKQNYSKSKPGVRLASDAQIKFARQLGGDPWEGITFEEVSKMIDEGKSRKEIEENKGSQKVHEQIAENDPHGQDYEDPIDQPTGKPLTEEEIAELGEEAFL